MKKAPHNLSLSYGAFGLLCASIFVFITTAIQASESCRGDIETCTPAQLCDASTTMLDGNTVWSTDPTYAEHVATSQQIGLDCGVVEIVAPTCETSAELCTIAALCDQATEASTNGRVSWSDEKAEHVSLAQEYGLQCGVMEEEAVEQGSPAEATSGVSNYQDFVLCSALIADPQNPRAVAWRQEIERRGLECNETAAEASDGSQSPMTAASRLADGEWLLIDNLTDAELCRLVGSEQQDPRVAYLRGELVSRQLNQGLSCESEASDPLDPYVDTIRNLSDTVLCRLINTGPNHPREPLWTREALTRGISCSDESGDYNPTVAQRNAIADLSDVALCRLLSTAPQHTRAQLWRREASVRGLECAIPQNTALRECPSSGRLHNCYGTKIQDDGDRWIGTWVNNRIQGVGTNIFGPGEWENDVRIGMADGRGDINGGQMLYVWSNGSALFEWSYNHRLSYNSNSTVNDVFPILTSSFQSLSRSERLAIHNSLARKGLYDAAIDGLWGRNTLIGIARFTGEHLNTVNLKSSENVRLVLAAIIEQANQTRTQVAASSVLAQVRQRDQAATRTVSTDFSNAFQGHSLLYRQQIQYALRELGMYTSGIDGVWGDGTRSALTEFVQANGLHSNGANDVFRRVVDMVDVPTSFAAPRQNAPRQQANGNRGLTALVSRPSVGATQALAICRPQAQEARRRASNAYNAPSYGSSAFCSRVGNFYDCDVSENSGGFWGGVAEGLGRSMQGRSAYESVLASCLAQYGWRQ